MNITHSISNVSQSITIPHIPELFNPNFLDILIPAKQTVKRPVLAKDGHNIPMLDALRVNGNRTPTSEDSDDSDEECESKKRATVLAFELLGSWSHCNIDSILAKAWEEDPELTMKIIWNLRSIRHGDSTKETFYRVFGWLYKHHPRTAICNLEQLILPLCKTGRTKYRPHGYWKDLLNILALATLDQLYIETEAEANFLHSPKTPRSDRKLESDGSIDPEVHNRENKVKAKATRAKNAADAHAIINKKLIDPTFRALYIAVARLFAEQLRKDMVIAHGLVNLPVDGDRTAVLERISLAAKWAPTPLHSHDRVTNISTAIALLLNHTRDTLPFPFPSAVSAQPDSRNTSEMRVLRSFYQRHILTFLRDLTDVTESHMSSGCWSTIPYNRVSSRCMRNNVIRFGKHDRERFEQYLFSVASDKLQYKLKTSGATYLPHELVSEAWKAREAVDYWSRWRKKLSFPKQFVKKSAETKLRVIEAQWKTLISCLRESGSLDNCIAVCDVSGSMERVHYPLRKDSVLPLLPAIGLSLVFARLAKPPFNNSFITFSTTPEFVTLDPALRLDENVEKISQSHCGTNINLKAIFLDLILPLAVKHNVKNEDMIKRIFVLSDKEFDSAAREKRSSSNSNHEVAGVPEVNAANEWMTNHDLIQKAFRERGYDLPEIVYWDLRSRGPYDLDYLEQRADAMIMGHDVYPDIDEDVSKKEFRERTYRYLPDKAFWELTHEETVEVEHPVRKGVSMMSGFSPGMMKVLMGEEDEEDEEWEILDESREVERMMMKVERLSSEETMKRALAMESYAGLRVVD